MGNNSFTQGAQDAGNGLKPNPNGNSDYQSGYNSTKRH